MDYEIHPLGKIVIRDFRRPGKFNPVFLRLVKRILILPVISIRRQEGTGSICLGIITDIEIYPP